MDVKAIKLELVQKIIETTEESILERIKSILDMSSERDWWDFISEEEKQAIDEGLADLDSGNTISHEEVLKKAKEKFNIR